jgi:DNA/RNA-binding domain of Phe-tRNA-synthetase-like protein
MVPIRLHPHRYLEVGLVAAEARPGPSPEPLVALLRRGAPLFLEDAAAREERRAAIRDLLRHSGYKPTGRGKPAQEYLAQVVEQEGTLASINAIVDANNATSLASGLPISVLDLDRLPEPIEVRPGRPGEAYVFNAAGQTIEVEGLVCLCAAGRPLGNAVKDSMEAKIGEGTRRILGVIWSHKMRVPLPQLRRALDLFAALLRDHAGATALETATVEAPEA